MALYEIQWVKLSTKHSCHSRPPAIPYKKMSEASLLQARAGIQDVYRFDKFF
jgi:hypothetical protein